MLPIIDIIQYFIKKVYLLKSKTKKRKEKKKRKKSLHLLQYSYAYSLLAAFTPLYSQYIQYIVYI